MTEIERDATRYRWIRRHSKLELGAYNSDSGWMREASKSWWYVRSESKLVGTNKRPDMDAAIDAQIAMGCRKRKRT